LTAGESRCFRDKGFKNEPKSCKALPGQARGRAAAGEAGQLTMRAETKTMLSSAEGNTVALPAPTQGRPVLCREFFQQRRAMRRRLVLNRGLKWHRSNKLDKGRRTCLPSLLQTSRFFFEPIRASTNLQSYKPRKDVFSTTKRGRIRAAVPQLPGPEGHLIGLTAYLGVRRRISDY